MKKTITMVLPTLAGLLLLAGAAHADFAAKCKMCHGDPPTSGPVAKIDLMASTVTLQRCLDAVAKGVTKDGKLVMPAVTLVAPDTADAICKGAPLNKKAAATAPAPAAAPTTAPAAAPK